MSDGRKITLWSPAENREVEASLHEEISPLNLEHWETNWLPLLKKHAKIAEDSHWDWRKKHELRKKAMLNFPCASVKCENMTQGLMYLELSLHRSRLEANQHLVYVDFLATAPWNREWPHQAPRFKLVGLNLVAHAISISMTMHSGRIGLHSLPGAVKFYRHKLKMKPFGKETSGEYRGLEYFEFSSQQAKEFMDWWKKR